MGFQTLYDLLPDRIGACVGAQSFAANGDALQKTTKGLLVWHKDTNWTAFTDGYRTWVNGPYGIQERLNTECFAWESESDVSSPMSQQLFAMLNTERQAAGAAPLALNCQLNRVAVDRAETVLGTGNLNHYDGNGRMIVEERLDKEGIGYAAVAENLAANSYPLDASPVVANADLMNSAPHRANMLNIHYNEVGIGVVGPGPGQQYFYAEVFLKA